MKLKRKIEILKAQAENCWGIYDDLKDEKDETSVKMAERYLAEWSAINDCVRLLENDYWAEKMEAIYIYNKY